MFRIVIFPSSCRFTWPNPSNFDAWPILQCIVENIILRLHTNGHLIELFYICIQLEDGILFEIVKTLMKNWLKKGRRAAIKPMRRRLLISIIDHREFFRSSKLVAKVVDIIQGMSTRMITFSNAPTFFHYSWRELLSNYTF